MSDEMTQEEVAQEEKAPKKPAAIASGTMVMCDDGEERAVITRDEAIEAGSNRYFTGLPCQKGHMVERKVKGYVCTTCARNRQKLRRKARVASDPDYKAKLAKKRAAKHKERYNSDPEYRQKVLDRAKRRRQKAAAERALNKAEAEVTADGAAEA